jgi:tetratricopeptide (TPR) repeat protein
MTHDPTVHPSLSELLSHYLQQRTTAQPGLRTPPVSDEVVPFESAPVQPVEPRLAWDEGTLVATYYGVPDEPHSKAPAEWATLVATHEPVLALPFCLGNFPQLVRDLHGLVQAGRLSSLRPVPSRPASLNSLESAAREAAAKNDPARLLTTLGLLRLARQFETASRFFEEQHSRWPQAWQAAAANERAALAWHQGNADEARRQWQAQEPSVPVVFNRGMAALFSDEPADAKTWLVQAVEQLPDDNAWHHLGRLYLALSSRSG